MCGKKAKKTIYPKFAYYFFLIVYLFQRSFVFKWFAAVAVDLGANLLASVLHIMLPALHRELNDTVRTQGKLNNVYPSTLS